MAEPGQLPLSFEDVAVYFSEQEWQDLQVWQRELYKHVMRSNYETLVSLGAGLPTPELISRIEQGRELCGSWGQSPTPGSIVESSADVPLDHVNERPLSLGSPRDMSSRETPCPVQEDPPRSLWAMEPLIKGDKASFPADSLGILLSVQSCDTWTPLQAASGLGALTHIERLPSFQEPLCWEGPPRPSAHGSEEPNSSQASDLQDQPRRAQRRLSKAADGPMPPARGSPRGQRTVQCPGCGWGMLLRARCWRRPSGPTGRSPWQCSACKMHFLGRGAFLGYNRRLSGARGLLPSNGTQAQPGGASAERPGLGTEQTGGPSASTVGKQDSSSLGPRQQCPQRPFSCLHYPELFPTGAGLTGHPQGLAGENPRGPRGWERRFQCGECGRGFRHQCKLREHLRVHSGERPFQCPECAKSFRLKGVLTAHERTHRAERPFPCAQCGRGFTRPSKLAEHLRVHSGERPFPCPDCGRRFRLQGQLRSHRRLHTGERPFRCADCDKSYRAQADLRAHQRLHRGPPPFACACGKAFAKRSKLAEHARTHTGEKPFPCPECDKRFRLKAQLLSHRGLHTGARPFRCPECDKAFRERGHLLRHQRIHRPERPFTCGDCGKGFIYKSKLAEHARVHAKPCRARREADAETRLRRLFAMIEADWS